MRMIHTTIYSTNMKIISVKCVYIISLIHVLNICYCYKILAIFPYNGRSHHIYFSSLIEELAVRNHDVTIINNFPLKNYTNLKQITLRNDNRIDKVNIDELQQSLPVTFKEFYRAYDTAVAFKQIANADCERLINNKELEELIKSKAKFDLVVVEQFVTDCGLAIAFKLNVTAVGMTAHVLMPWTYSRLGALNHPAFVPNHFFATGTKPNLWTRIKSFIINLSMTMYYQHFIQTSDHEIVKEKYPDVPNLESLGKSLSLIMLNQYFPLTGSRLQAANVIEVGGMHIKMVNEIKNETLISFLDTAKQGVIYISFGTVADNLPKQVIAEIIKLIEFHRTLKFVWKIDTIKGWNPPENVILRKWFPQISILCHRNIKAFISHSGMLSSSEAMYCGVPIISVPLFGDQFANAASAIENGLAVVIDFETISSTKLQEALQIILSEKYQIRAKELSVLWKDRAMSPVDTAIYWLEYVIKHKNIINLKPAIVDLPLYQYLMLDIISVLIAFVFITAYVICRVLNLLKNCYKDTKTAKQKKRD